jgi:TRAP-type C4-dicarboxylate transport system permease small subunit
MHRIKHVVDRALAWTVIALMALLVVDVLWQVFTRFILRDPSSYTEELARYLLIWVGLLGAAHAAGKQLHLAVDLLPERLSGAKKRRVERFIEVAAILFALPVLVIGGSRLVWVTLYLGQTSAALGIPTGYVYAVVPLSGLLIAFYSVYRILYGSDEHAPADAPHESAEGA